jgi:hypothetical protein
LAFKANGFLLLGWLLIVGCLEGVVVWDGGGRTSMLTVGSFASSVIL